MNIKNQLENRAEQISRELEKVLSNQNLPQKHVFEAMEYSLTAGGKRIRPFLLTEFYTLCGGENISDVVNFALAVEFIHTYSLIHDDLPCMDDDDFRRGEPSCHKKYGEDIALLAGDSLLTMAFELCLQENDKIDPLNVIKAAAELSSQAGIMGMIGGQAIDIESEGKEITPKALERIHLLKTAALIKASCKMGAILANATEKEIILAEKYAEKIGLSFQIIDDVLDATSTFETLGKPIGSDEELSKTTYYSLYGEEKCRKMANELTKEALALLNEFNGNPIVLKDFALMLLERKA